MTREASPFIPNRIQIVSLNNCLRGQKSLGTPPPQVSCLDEAAAILLAYYVWRPLVGPLGQEIPSPIFHGRANDTDRMIDIFP